MPVTFTGNTATVYVDTLQGSPKLATSCGGAGGSDLAFKLRLAEAGDLTLTATPVDGGLPDGGSARPIVAITAATDGGACVFGISAAGLGCGAAADFGAKASVTAYNLPAGDYFALLDSFGSMGEGPSTLVFTVAAPTPPPPNDECAQAAALTFTNDLATAAGDTTAATNSVPGDGGTPVCSATARSSGKDVSYSYTLSEPRNVTITVAPGADGGFRPVVSVLGSCAGGELACSTLMPNASEVGVDLFNQPAGTYFIWVDGAAGGGGGAVSSGPFTLKVKLEPTQAGDLCSSAVPIGLDGGANASFVVDTSPFGDDFDGTCSGPGSTPEAIYRLTTTGQHDIRVTAVRAPLPDGGASPADPVLYVRGSLCDNGPQLGCADQFGATPEVINLHAQPAGDYYLFIEANVTAAGPTRVTVSLSPPTLEPAGDTCASAIPIALDGGAFASFTVDTFAFNHDTNGTCSSAGDSREAVYELTTVSPRDITVTAAPVALADGGVSATDAVVYVRAGACDLGTQLACQDSAAASATEAAKLKNVPAGDYFIFVEGYDGPSSGPTAVTVSVAPPTTPSPGDTCASAIVLALDGGSATVSGDTTLANPDYDNACAFGIGGNDLVYRFALTSASRVFARVTPASPPAPDAAVLNPYLYLRDATSCANTDGGGSPGCVAADTPGGAASLVASALPAGTYFLVVDGTEAGPRGPFQLTLETSPVAVAQNDDCGSAQLLTFTNGSATVSGTTHGAVNDLALSCADAGTPANPDVVYQFATPAAAARYNARAMIYSTNLFEYEAPAVQVQAACALDGGAKLSCGTIAGDVVVYALGLDAGATYFAWVDSNSTTRPSGPFEFKLDVEPTPAVNDACGTATQIGANTSIAGSTLGAADDYTSASHYSTAACANSDTFKGADVVYAFSPTTTAPATVRLVPQRGFDPAVFILSACATNSCIGFSDEFGAREAVTFDAAAGSTYYIVIDSFVGGAIAQSRGGFIVSVAQ